MRTGPLVRGTLITLACLLAIPLNVFLFLVSPWGTSRMAGTAEVFFAEEFQGRLLLGSVEWRGWGRVGVEGILLEDPHGDAAATVREIDLDFDTFALLQGRLVIDDLQLRGFVVKIVSGDPSAGLPAVFLPSHPPTAAPPEGPSAPPHAPFPIELHGLHLDDGGFLLTDLQDAPEVMVRDIWIWARGAWVGEAAQVELHLEGAPLLPTRGPLSLRLDASLSSWDLELADLRVTLGGTRLEVSGKGNLNRLEGDVSLSGVVGTAGAQQVGVPIERDIPFEAEVRLGDESRVQLLLAPEKGGRILLRGKTESFLRFEGSAELDDLDPAAWLEGAPKGKIQADIQVSGKMQGRTDLRLSARFGKGDPIGPGSLSARLRGEVLGIDRLDLTLPGGRLTGGGTIASGKVNVDATLLVSDLRRIADRLRPHVPGALPLVAGKGSVRVQGEGSLQNLALRLALDFQELTVDDLLLQGLHLRGEGDPARESATVRGGAALVRFRGLEIRDAILDASLFPGGRLSWDLRGGARKGDDRLQEAISRGSLTYANKRVIGTLALALSGVGLVEVQADLPVPPGEAKPSAPLFLDLRIDPVDLAALGRLLAVGLPPGLLRARLRLAGTVGEPDGNLHAFLEELRPPVPGPAQAFDLRLASVIGQGRVTVEGSGFRTSGERLLEFEATVPVQAAQALRDPGSTFSGILASRASRAQANLRGIDLALVGTLLDLPDLVGVASAEIDLQGPIEDPRGQVRVGVSGGPLGPVRQVDLAVYAFSSDEEVGLELQLATPDQPSLVAKATVGTSLRRLLSGFPTSAETSLEWSLDEFDLASLEVEKGLVGTLRTSGSWEGTLADLRGEALLDLRDLGFQGTSLGSMELRASLAPEMELHFFAIDPDEGTARASLRVEERHPLRHVARRNVSALLEAPATLAIDAVSFSLGPLALLPPVAHAEGDLFLDLSASGPLGSLFPVGRIEVERGEAQLVGGIRYDRLGLRASLGEERIEVSLLEAHGGEGLAVVRGHAVRKDALSDFEFTFRSDGFPIGGEQGVAAFLSTRGELTGSLGKEGLDATVELASADIELPAQTGRQLQGLAPPEDVVLFGEEREGAGERERKRPALPMEIHVRAASPVSIRGPEVSASADVDLEIVRDETGEVMASGSAEAREGKATLLGRTFRIEPSEVRWSASPLGNPFLDITARFQGAGATAWVDIGGTVRSPTVSLRSDPPLPEGEIALLIAAGGTQAPGLTPIEGEAPPGRGAQGESQEVGAAASLLGSLAANRLQQVFGSRLPGAVLSVEAAEGRTLVQAGTYIGPRLYFGYARNVLPEPGENANEARITYQLSRTIGVQSRFGDAANGGVDLVWVEQFPTGAQIRARRREEPAAEPPPETGPAEEETSGDDEGGVGAPEEGGS